MSFFDVAARCVERSKDTSDPCNRQRELFVGSRIFEIVRDEKLAFFKLSTPDVEWLIDSFMLPFRRIVIDETFEGRSPFDAKDIAAGKTIEEINAEKGKVLIQQLAFLYDPGPRSQPACGLGVERRFQFVTSFTSMLSLFAAGHEFGISSEISGIWKRYVSGMLDDIGFKGRTFADLEDTIVTYEGSISWDGSAEEIQHCCSLLAGDLMAASHSAMMDSSTDRSALRAPLIHVDNAWVTTQDGKVVYFDDLVGDAVCDISPADLVDPQGIVLTRVALKLCLCFFDLMKLNRPKNFVLESRPKSHERACERARSSGRIVRSTDRPHYIILRPEEVRRRMRIVPGNTTESAGEGESVRYRRAHWRYLWADRFVNKQFEWVPVTAIWPDDVESIVGDVRYRVFLSYNHDWPGFKPTEPPKHRRTVYKGDPV